jgi:hypothetical protein
MVGSEEMNATLPSCPRTSRLVRLFFNVLLPRFKWKRAIALTWMQSGACGFSGFMREAVTHCVLDCGKKKRYATATGELAVCEIRTYKPNGGPARI